MSQISEEGEIALDRASNIKIFEKLATPHMVDTRRIEALKQFNAVSDLPIGRPSRSQPQYTVEDEEDEEGEDNRSREPSPPQVHPAVAMLAGGDNDSIAAILRDGRIGALRRRPARDR